MQIELKIKSILWFEDLEFVLFDLKKTLCEQRNIEESTWFRTQIALFLCNISSILESIYSLHSICMQRSEIRALYRRNRSIRHLNWRSSHWYLQHMKLMNHLLLMNRNICNVVLTILNLSYYIDWQALFNIALNAILADHAEKNDHSWRRRDLQQERRLQSKRSRRLMIRTCLNRDLNNLRDIQRNVWVIEIEKIDFIDFACREKKKKLRSEFRANAKTCNSR